MSLLVRLLFLSFCLPCYGFVDINTLGCTLQENIVYTAVYGNAETTMDEFRMTYKNELGDFLDKKIVSRILNPGGVAELYQSLLDLKDQEFDDLKLFQRGQLTDLYEFFAKGESHLVNTPTSSCTWDPSIFGNIIRPRLSNKGKIHLGIYRALYASENFPVIALSYNLNLAADVTGEMMARYQKDEKDPNKKNPQLLMPDGHKNTENPLGDELARYYDAASDAKKYKFLVELYNKRKKTGPPENNPRGAVDARRWREVPFLGKPAAKEDTWIIDSSLLAYLTVFSWDPEYSSSVNVFMNDQPRDTNQKNARLTIRYYDLKKENLDVILKWCYRFKYLFPDVDLDELEERKAEGQQAVYQELQATERTILEDDNSYKEFISDHVKLLKVAEKRNFLFLLSQALFGINSEDTFKEERLPEQNLPDFTDLWRSVWGKGTNKKEFPPRDDLRMRTNQATVSLVTQIDKIKPDSLKSALQAIGKYNKIETELISPTGSKWDFKRLRLATDRLATRINKLTATLKASTEELSARERKLVTEFQALGRKRQRSDFRQRFLNQSILVPFN